MSEDNISPRRSPTCDGPAEEVRPAEETQLTVEVRAAETTRPAEEAQPAETTRPAEEAQPAETTRPAEEAQLAVEERAAEEAQPAAHVSTATQEPPLNEGACPKVASPLQSPRAQGLLEGVCVQCGGAMGKMLGSMSSDGPVHNECIVKYRLTHVELCAHCDRKLEGQRLCVGGSKLHPGCVADFKSKTPFQKRRKEGVLKKFSIGRSSGLFGGKNWKDRYFVLSEASNTLCFFESQAHATQGKQASCTIPMQKDTTRLITRPMRKHHPEASNVSREFVVVFMDGTKEQRLLCQTTTWEEHEAWCDVLHDYIRSVDVYEDGVEIV